jgi:hypothetical protein
MAYQFIHIETYSRSSKSGTSARSIIGEATREDGYCPHVAKPQQPVILSGPHPGEWYAGVDERASQAKDKLGRKIRKDAHLIVAGVASYPVRCKDLDDSEREKLMAWAEETITWFEKKHGKGCAVMHLDEEFPHIHMYAEADLAAGQRAGDLHPGEAAKKNAPNKKLAKKSAYTGAMRQYQSDYFQDVASRYGMARTGPERRRMTRAEWQAEQATLKQMAERQQKAEKALSAASERASEVTDQAQKQYLARLAEAEKTASVMLDKATGEVASWKEAITRRESHLATQQDVIVKRSSEIDRLEKDLSKKTDLVKTKLSSISKREKSVAAFERRSAGVWGTLVSVVTLGQKGVSKRIREAQNVERKKAQEEIKKVEAEAKKIESQKEKKILRLDDSIKNMQQRTQKLESQKEKISDLQSEIKVLEHDFTAAKKETLSAQIRNATSEKDLRIQKGYVNDARKALKNGDIDRLDLILSKMDEGQQGGGTGTDTKPVKESGPSHKPGDEISPR